MFVHLILEHSITATRNITSLRGPCVGKAFSISGLTLSLKIKLVLKKASSMGWVSANFPTRSTLVLVLIPLNKISFHDVL